MSRVAPARAAAFEILLKIERGSGRSDELLHTPAIDRLSEQDRNLATNLVMGTLRWQIVLDSRIAAFLNRPGTQLAPEIRIALRMGAFQLLYLDRIPMYAAIGESVELAKRAEKGFAAGMVNAVLRKMAASVEKPQGGAGTAAVEAHPSWLVGRWARNFGTEAARRICEYDQEPAPVHLRLVTPDAEEMLRRDGIEVAPANFLINVRRVSGGNIAASTALRDGLVRIQDEGSQLIAELAGGGERILDACAAPGGKTAILAERNPEASITAVDISRKRLAEMERMLKAGPHGRRIRFELGDVAKIEFKPEFDLVLCDAPCSGTGTLARNPEIRHRLSAEELIRQHKNQVAILLSVMKAVKPGGRLLYSTCSLEPEENEQVVRKCLEGRDDFEIAGMEQEIERLEGSESLMRDAAREIRATALENHCLRTLPGVHKCDGFFAALLVRRI